MAAADEGRLGEARRRLAEVLSDPVNALSLLSNVIYDAHDWNDDATACDHGFDPDDLAAVLLPVLQEAQEALAALSAAGFTVFPASA